MWGWIAQPLRSSAWHTAGRPPDDETVGRLLPPRLPSPVIRHPSLVRRFLSPLRIGCSCCSAPRKSFVILGCSPFCLRTVTRELSAPSRSLAKARFGSRHPSGMFKRADRSHEPEGSTRKPAPLATSDVLSRSQCPHFFDTDYQQASRPSDVSSFKYLISLRLSASILAIYASWLISLLTFSGS